MTLATKFGTDVVITGVGHTPFGKLVDQTLESLVVTVTRQALDDAGLEAGDIDAVYLGQFNAGMWPMAFPSSLVLQADDGFLGTPVTRVENACGSGAAAFQTGLAAMLAGTAQRVLVVGAEKMTHADASVVGAALLGADYDMAGRESVTGFAGLFAQVAHAYRDKYDDPSDAMARIAAKSHTNGAQNPWAHLRKDFDLEFCSTVSEKNPMVAEPLRRTDCSPVSDGAAALVLERAGATTRAKARVLGFGHANDYLPARRKDLTEMFGVRTSIEQALAMADVTLDDLDFAEVHDCFTIAELLIYEAMGLTPRGQGARAVTEGWVHADGRLPVNPSGGLKSKGHPVGATGVSQLVMSALQMVEQAPGVRVSSPRHALVQNMGGVAVANYAAVLGAV